MTTHNTNSGAGHQNINNDAGTQNVVYGGGQIGEVNNAGRDFVKNFNTTVSNPHKSLWDSIAGVGASHAAEQQYERGECLKGTREAVLGSILDWRSAKKQDRPICWLTGAAGVGKTAIAITVAKSCDKEGSLASSFVFFRSDPQRNNPAALVLTIAHGLASTMPFMRFLIERRISKDPRILEANMEEQLRELVLIPIKRWSWLTRLWAVLIPLPAMWGLFSMLSVVAPLEIMWPFFAVVSLAAPPKTPDVVIIDGLDECSDEDTQLRILKAILSLFQQDSHFPLRFLICSRPEAWIQEAFVDNPLCQLTVFLPLDDTVHRLAKFIAPGDEEITDGAFIRMGERDILVYYLHHFQEISRNPKYSRVPFPSHWPSKEDLEALCQRTCSQFVYAVTVVRFVKLAFNHPIVQLRIILDNTLPLRPGTSPFRQLDMLYQTILSANPAHQDVISILSAILILPPYLSPTPSHIELLLELPVGQVTLALRGMHSVLDIHGSNFEIRLLHTSFREYLLEHTRSHTFHIDMHTQAHALARQWLQKLTTRKIKTYRFDKLFGEETQSFFTTSWIGLCTSIPEPTRDLLDCLRNVDLASTYAMSGMTRLDWTDDDGWEKSFERLVPWVRKCAQGSEELDFMEKLVHKFQQHPACFHLEVPHIGGSLQDRHILGVIYRIAAIATACPRTTSLNRLPNVTQHVFRLTDCHCDTSGGHSLCDSEHLAYQKACVQLVQAFIALFMRLIQSGVKDRETIGEVGFIFQNLMESSLLLHSCLDSKLLSLCEAFIDSAKGCSFMEIDNPDGERGRENMLMWTETFPYTYAEQGEALRLKVLALPWTLWQINADVSPPLQDVSDSGYPSSEDEDVSVDDEGDADGPNRSRVACSSRKDLNLRCEFDIDAEPCKWCLSSGRERMLPGRKKRGTPPKREHVLAKIQKQTETINKLMSQLTGAGESEKNIPDSFTSDAVSKMSSPPLLLPSSGRTLRR
ncbi:hypothetical protein PQX77_003774 [Marasmius sp. AFHP31]|nr:hypothetical protein PQX77_003774 [Marasmius sp. AFHP31]